MPLPAIAAIGFLFFIVAYYTFGYMFRFLWDIFLLCLSWAKGICLNVLGVLIDVYKSLIVSHPFIFLACVALLVGLKKAGFSRLKYKHVVGIAPIISTLFGELAYGHLSLNISITDSGLLFVAVTVLFGIYFALLKANVISSTEKGSINKMLNHSFVVVLLLMGGAFGIILVDKIAPLVRTAS